MDKNLINTSNSLSHNIYCDTLPKIVSNMGIQKKPKHVAAHSNFNTPIGNNVLSGRSRLWGDASNDVKLNALNQIIHEAKTKNFNLDQIAFGLSVAHVESGFNPDAAASTTSASGLGQFINKTGAAYGLNEKNRFNIKENSEAMISELGRLMKYTEKKHSPDSLNDLFSLSYSHYHDGNKLTQSTIESSKSKFPSLVNTFKNFLVSSCEIN